jgi:hypothetical protein
VADTGAAGTVTERCTCADPIVVVQAERKGAAVSVCARCGRPVRLTL